MLASCSRGNMHPYRDNEVLPWCPHLLPWWGRYLDPFLSDFRWFRKMVGGRWARYFIAQCGVDVWLYLDHWTYWSLTEGDLLQCHNIIAVEEYPHRC